MEKESNFCKTHWISCLIAVYLSSVFLFYNFFCKQHNYFGHFLLQCFAGIVMALCIYEIIDKKKRRLFHWPALLLWFWCISSACWCDSNALAFSGILEITCSIFFLCGLPFIFDVFPILARSFSTIILIVGSFLLSIYCSRLLWFSFDIKSRFGYPFGNPNFAASLFIICIILCACKAYFAKKEKKWKLFILFVITGIIFFTFLCCNTSKGAILSLLLVLALGVLWLYYKKRWVWISFFTSILLALLLCLYYGSYIFQYSASIRILIWKICWKAITFSPFHFFFGWGAGSFLTVFEKFQDQSVFNHPRTAEVVDFAHNFYLEFWLEYGLIGLLLWLSIFIIALFLAWKLFHNSRKKYIQENSLCYAGILTALAFQAFVSTSFSYFQTQFFYLLAIAWIWYISRRNNTTQCIIKYSIFRSYWIVGFFFLWICFILPDLFFQIQYQQIINSSWNEKIHKIKKITLPPWESFYTLQWRCSLGELILNDPIFSQFEKEFHKGYSIAPNYEYFKLYNAMLLATHHQIETSKKEFIEFSSDNPFTSDLWRFWEIIASSNSELLLQLHTTALYYKMLYPDHGTFDFAIGLVMIHKKKYQQAILYLERAYEWSLLKTSRFSYMIEQEAKHYLNYIHEINKKQ